MYWFLTGVQLSSLYTQSFNLQRQFIFLQGHFYILRTWDTAEFPAYEHSLTAHANFLKEIKDGLRGFFPNWKYKFPSGCLPMTVKLEYQDLHSTDAKLKEASSAVHLSKVFILRFWPALLKQQWNYLNRRNSTVKDTQGTSSGSTEGMDLMSMQNHNICCRKYIALGGRSLLSRGLVHLAIT